MDYTLAFLSLSNIFGKSEIFIEKFNFILDFTDANFEDDEIGLLFLPLKNMFVYVNLNIINFEFKIND